MDDSLLDASRAAGALAEDYDVEVFSDGSAAIERLASGAPPDVLVLDWLMPGVTGIDVCRFLRSERGDLERLGILLLTAQRRTEQIVEGLAAGANDYLAKPWENAELQARVAALVRSRELMARLTAAEKLSERLLASFPDPFLAIDDADRVSYASSESGQILGFSPAKAIGMSVRELLPGLDVDAVRNDAPLRDFKVGERVYAPTVRVLPNERVHAVISLRDVTEIRRLERRRLDFYSIIAHDLRAPLNAITLRIGLIEQGKHGEVPASLLADARKIDQSLRSLSAMIDDFLDIARLDAGAYPLASEEVDLQAIVDGVVEEASPLLDAKKIRWARGTKSPGARVRGDERRLKQVVGNLVGNAIKFTPEGGRIETTVAVRDGSVECAVADTGPGIAQELLPTLFERYVRGTDETTGTGLGLMIAREIVLAHGGNIGADSALGAGSRFWFRIPVSHALGGTPA